MVRTPGPLDGPIEDGLVFCLQRCTETLYRSPQPLAREWLQVWQTGIRTVINLRAEDNSEEPRVRDLGMHYVHLPVVDWDIPTDEQVAQFIRTAEVAEEPILVHCLGGIGRTGTMVTCYRIHLGIPPLEALRLQTQECTFLGIDMNQKQALFVQRFARMRGF